MRTYVVRLGSCRRDGLYLVCANDYNMWTVTSAQRRATRMTSLYQADVAAEGIGDARVVRLRRRRPRPTSRVDQENK